jgi:hypothetical protein
VVLCGHDPLTGADHRDVKISAPAGSILSDLLTGMLPLRREHGGPFDWWHQMRPRFFAYFQHCLPALAAAGND